MVRREHPFRLSRRLLGRLAPHVVVLVAAATAWGCASVRNPTVDETQRRQTRGPPSGRQSIDAVAAEVVKAVDERDGTRVYALYSDRMRAEFSEDFMRRFVSSVADGVGRVAWFEVEGSAESNHASYRLHGGALRRAAGARRG